MEERNENESKWGYMVLGLKRGTVELAGHDPEWEKIAAQTIRRLWRVLGSAAKDIQHVGSTAIVHIKAKPIIDLAVAVDDFAEVEKLIPALEFEGFSWRRWENDQRMLFAIGDYSQKSKGIDAQLDEQLDWLYRWREQCESEAQK